MNPPSRRTLCATPARSAATEKAEGRRGAHQASSARAETSSGRFVRAGLPSDWALRRPSAAPQVERKRDMTETIDHRPSWDEYFMKLANEVATRTTCLRRGGGCRHREGPPHPGHRLQRRAHRHAPLRRDRLPAPAARRAQRAAPRDLPRPARRAERHHPGGALRHQHHGRVHLREHAALRRVRQDAHQRRHRGDRLPEPVSRRAGHVHARGSRHEDAHFRCT